MKLEVKGQIDEYDKCWTCGQRFLVGDIIDGSQQDYFYHQECIE